jgi:hypothetical protein
MSFFNKKSKVTVEMIHKENAEVNNIVEFWFLLNEDVNELEISINVNNQLDEIIPESRITFFKNKWYLLAGYENYQIGKWKFNFKGTLKKDKTQFKTSIKYNLAKTDKT